MKKLLILILLLTGTLVSFAQKAKDTMPKGKMDTAKTVYTCPMHLDVTSNRPGKCSKCGMTLVAKKVDKKARSNKPYYTCTMHPEVISDKPGKCPKCGMVLVKKEPVNHDKMKM
ncbi:heavy metal-binding domain-containing protein [Flavitalea sp. BT771]|uniref:heavy metal-binding domain-containing protein n=1 Tax=Flavitalea sp. BT771 TaxID=3063329 RepID=UPI0026E20FD0|nr:heavy metal-binding domain-containing protein [Flavitalea sp. BT771]MDO6429965.1 heavy metal-binding domain-containing protein [Flavitalea sp. BT771]MDV6217907.1 heavy metal-binding domain-containing protein [Flavitalea sp. BT771]